MLLMPHCKESSTSTILNAGCTGTSVSEVAGELKHQKLINSRGLVAILNRSGLEKRACECYAVSKKEFARLLGDIDLDSAITYLTKSDHNKRPSARLDNPTLGARPVLA